MGTAALFEAFDLKIACSESESTEAFRRGYSCAAVLSQHYYDGNAPTDHMTLIGSVAKHTATTPIADIDLMFHMPLPAYLRFDGYAGNGQSALLQEVRSLLKVRYPSTEIRGDGPVVVVAFSSGCMVEIVPGVLVNRESNMLSATCWVPITREGGTWEQSDYGAEWSAIHTANDQSSGQLTRLINNPGSVQDS